MTNTGFLDVSELSFDGIKNNLKTFMKSKTQFKDYDFEGSNLNSLLDVLSYNTYMNAFYLNMIGSEMFLDSSQLRNSIVSHAKELNYIPRSRTSARAKVTFAINTGADVPINVVIPENYTIRTTIDGINMDFTTDESITVNRSDVGYVSDSVYVYEGKIVYEFFTVDGTARYSLDSSNIDVNSIRVTVINSASDTSNTVYTKADTLYGLTSNSEIYFVQGYNNDQYEIVFGDGISGKALANGNIVKVKYRSTNGELGNKAVNFAVSTAVGDTASYPVTVTTNISAADGSERETIESIKLNAPRHFAAQNRAVTKDDYTTLIIQKYPQIKTVNVYGGENAIPPQYGKVIISMIPYGNFPVVSAELKTDIIAYLKTKSITTEPVIKDPEYMYIEIQSAVSYNPSLTAKSIQQLKSDVLSKVQSYETTYLNNFGNDFRKSRLSSLIDSADASIVSNQTTLRAIYTIVPTKGIKQRIAFSFSNPLARPLRAPYIVNETECITSSLFDYFKDGVYYNSSTPQGPVTLSDDGNGFIRLYYTERRAAPAGYHYMTDGKLMANSEIPNYSSANHVGQDYIIVQQILESNLGTVNYDTGEVSFDINPYNYDANIKIFAKIINDDIVVQETKYLKIDYDEISINITAYRQ